ncbi:hypothetical protein P7M07_11140 [Vibrio parahaemolyticus]|nr:hypothetical protein [Vibrio parahaemolyticus]MDG2673567.1 hypothetical protein [Vibrio parahaemolyticus]
MENDDLIVRLSGPTDAVSAAFAEIKECALSLGITTEDVQVNETPLKVEQSKVKATKSIDIMARVVGDESTVEAFLNEVSEMVTETFGLNPPSSDLSIENLDEEDEK